MFCKKTGPLRENPEVFQQDAILQAKLPAKLQREKVC
jgi:hypothetical protein